MSDDPTPWDNATESGTVSPAHAAVLGGPGRVGMRVPAWGSAWEVGAAVGLGAALRWGWQ